MSTTSDVAEQATPSSGVRPRRVVRAGLPPLVVAVIALWAIPQFFNGFWLFEMTAGVVAIVVMQSLGILTGRVGVMSLCQLSFAMIGAWTVGWCNVHGVPGGFYVWLILGGIIAVPFGLIIGLPALRLRGINLAIITFAFATALDVIFAARQFPGAQSFEKVARPAGFTSDAGYFRFAVIIVAILFVVLVLLDRTRLGASWLEVRYSERGAAAHGTSVARSKLAAFGISAFFAGVCGALMAGQAGTITSSAFTAQGSLVLFAIAVVIGTRFWDAAVLAGLFSGVMPAVLDHFNINQNYVSIGFGIIAVLILGGGKGQLGQSEIMRARQEAKKARKLQEQRNADERPSTTDAEAEPEQRPYPAHAPNALEIRDMHVQFGAVTAVNHVSLEIPKASVVALIGPNGAGKSTLINAATGFAPYRGSVLVDGRPVDGQAPHRRARGGLRRSFQQLRVPPTLPVGRFLALAAGRRLSTEETNEFLEWFECPPAHVSVGTMDVGSRRILEVAGLAAGKPSVLLLDEPAAGLGARETTILARRISQIPEHTGSTVVLVEHDIDVIRSACQWVSVMDFGSVIASGPPADVLDDPAVVKAYIGGEAAADAPHGEKSGDGNADPADPATTPELAGQHRHPGAGGSVAPRQSPRGPNRIP